MSAVYVFGILAAGFWAGSAFVSVRSLRVKLDLGPPPTADRVAISVSTAANGGQIKANGMALPLYSQIEEYRGEVTFWAAWTAGLNSAAAVCAVIAALLAACPAP